jgi:single-stranded DNA-binding protein
MNGPDGFEFSGRGKLQRIDTFVSKAGKDILTLVIETQGQYPQLVPIKVFGRMAEMASGWQPGCLLEITGRLGGRDWNGKVYGDNVASTIEVVSQGSRPSGQRSQGTNTNANDDRPPVDDDVPF